MKTITFTVSLTPSHIATIAPTRVVAGKSGICLYTDKYLHKFPAPKSLETLALHCASKGVLFQTTPELKEKEELVIELPMLGPEPMPANGETVKRLRHETLYTIKGWDRAAFDARFEEICREFPPFGYSTAYTTTKDGWQISRGNSAD